MTNFDDILMQTGKFGWFQIRTYLVICIMSLVAAMMAFVQVFIAGTNDHWCKVAQWEEEGCSQWNMTEVECSELKRSLSQPEFDNDDKRDSRCLTYNFTGIDIETAYANRDDLMDLEIIKCDDGWNFDTSLFPSTITEDWELVCDKAFIPNVLQSVYLGGFLLGCIIYGVMADKFGRYYTFLISNVSAGVFGLLCTLSSNYIIFGLLRFLVGASAYGTILVGFVLGTELVVPEMRVYVGVALWYFFAIGYFVLSGVARYLANWRAILAVFALPYLICLPSFLMITESPRWLLTKNRYHDAERIIYKIAQVNGKPKPQNILSQLTEAKEDNNVKQASLLDVIRCPTLLFYLINLWFNWFVQSFLYYGLSLGTSDLGVNAYVAFCISGAVEIPAYVSSIYSMRRFGRKLSTAVLMIMAGTSCFLTILTPNGPARVTVAMVGKFAISASFANVYVLTAEIFPTPLRALSIGACSVAARIGGIVAPLTLVLDRVWEPLPLVLFATSSVLAGVLVFLLPETKGKAMPDTIEDSLNLRNSSYKEVANNEDNNENGSSKPTDI
ncbi:organic cation transporter protein-like [Apostichopus japonicus]|uniref:organic cation transporter protein-like n=1 Tax=Stichopus japonicus TaxID=307972 RepID=UPI003AB76113